jgi:hypothetical protein
MLHTRQALMLILIFIFKISISQNLLIVPGLTAQYSYFAKANMKETDFKLEPKFNGAWFIDIYYKPKKTSYKISVKESVLGESFSINNNFGNDTSLGIRKVKHSDGIDQLTVMFQIQKFITKKNDKNDSYLKWFFDLGIGIGFNRTKNYYDSFLTINTTRRDGTYNYVQYTTSFARKGLGFFLSSSIGFNWTNARGKMILVSELYADLGLIKMLKVNLDYEYGTYTNPPLFRKVNDQVLYSNGTNFGFKVGIPITILRNRKNS